MIDYRQILPNIFSKGLKKGSCWSKWQSWPWQQTLSPCACDKTKKKTSFSISLPSLKINHLAFAIYTLDTSHFWQGWSWVCVVCESDINLMMAQQLSGRASESKFCRCEVWFLNRTHKIFFFLPSWQDKVSLTPLFLYQIQIFSIFNTAYTHLSLVVHFQLLTLVCLQTVPWTDPESGLIHLVSPGILCHDTSETKTKKIVIKKQKMMRENLKKINPYHCSVKTWLCNFANCYQRSQIHNSDCKNITDHFS